MGVDLHLHSTASDGTVPPELVPSAAHAAGIHVMALTDHDTIAGVSAATASGHEIGVRVIAGCEFSVAAWWGELHLLGYFLPLDDADLEAFLVRQRKDREGRITEILTRLANGGVHIKFDAVLAEAKTGSLGRPHVARAMVNAGIVGSVSEAFDRFLADGKPGFVPRQLVDVTYVVDLVRRLGGVTSAAHLKDRGTRTNLTRLREIGVDAVEVQHPAHDARVSSRLHQDASDLGMLMTGGSDWHGAENPRRVTLGAVDVPYAWLQKIENVHRERAA